VPSDIERQINFLVEHAVKGNESCREQWTGDNRKDGGHASARLSGCDSYGLQSYRDVTTFDYYDRVFAMGIDR